MVDQIRSFGKGSSGGVTGLRAEYLVGALAQTTAVGVTTTLLRLVNWMKDAKAPREVQEFFAGARLTALTKKNLDIRPIAAGEILRRLVSKCLCAMHKEAAATFFAGVQYGVATPAGAERMIHLVRREMAKRAFDGDWVLLKVDLKNAFNRISRARMLELVLVHMPHMYSWVEWCYAQDSNLTFSEFRIPSREGVQQGDPLGPLLFSIVIQELIKKIAVEVPGLDLNKWYLDDGVLAGRAADVRLAYKLILDHGPALGIFLNEGKCELITHPASAASLDAWGPDTIPADMRRTDGCTSLLGAPIGDDAFCADFVRKESLEPARRTLQRLGIVKDAQVAVTLLRNCTGFCQLVYSLRATPPEQLKTVGAEFDSVVLAALKEAAFGIPDSVLSQVRRGTRTGGLGIRSAAAHHEAAYISSVTYAASKDGWVPSSAPGFLAAVSAYNAKVEKQHHLGTDGALLARTAVPSAPLPPSDAAVAPDSPPPSPPLKQRDLSAAIDAVALKEEFAAATRTSRRRLTSESGLHASRWLTVVPDPARFQDFTSREYITLLRWWLGMDVYPTTGPCPLCSQQMDPRGYHALVCKKGGGKVYRHHTLCNVYATYAKGAFLAPQREKSVGAGRSRPADVYLPVWDGRPMALDFACTHSLQPKYSKLADDAPAGSVAAAYARNHKGGHYAQCSREGVEFRPMVCEVFGCWDPLALSVLKATADQFATHQGLEPGIALQFLATRLSVALMRQNVRIILARAQCVDVEGVNVTGGAEGTCEPDDEDSDDEQEDTEDALRDPHEAEDNVTPVGSDSDADAEAGGNDGAEARSVMAPTA